jgi:beta-aspartyl-peptidase (threonine type)
MEPVIVIHTGVGSTPRSEQEPEKVAALADLAIAAVDAGFQLLNSSEPRAALKAVEVAVNVLESSGIVNAGLGAVRQIDGVQRMDASIMDGPTLSFGCVSSLEGIKHPVSVARKFLDFSELEGTGEQYRWHSFFCGYYIDKIFEIHGEQVPDEWRIEPGSIPSLVPSGNRDPPGETVGAVAMDADGHLAAATSTGGLEGAFPGRIGDTPVIGGGTYANQWGAVSNTGRGENIIKIVAAKRACDFMQDRKLNAMLAVDRMLKEYKEQLHDPVGTIGTIAIDQQGKWTVQFTGTAMTWAEKDSNGGSFGQFPGEKRPF